MYVEVRECLNFPWMKCALSINGIVYVMLNPKETFCEKGELLLDFWHESTVKILFFVIKMLYSTNSYFSEIY